MTPQKLVLPALTLLLAAPAAHADPFLPVPPASFLNYHVDTAGQLSEQIALDGTVRARLAKYFHMPEAALAAYVRDNLVQSRLTETARYQVACVSSSGREFWLSERLPMGTPVFSLRDTGQPILRLVCGNPLVKTLPKVKAKPLAPAQLTPTPAHAAPVAAVPGSPVAVAAAAPASKLAGPGLGRLGPLVRVAGVTQHVGGHGGSFLPILGVIPFLPHGGGHSSPPGKPSVPGTPTTPVTPKPPVTPTPPVTPPVVPPVTPPHTAPVPEPSPALFFTLAGAGLIALRLRAQKKAR